MESNHLSNILEKINHATILSNRKPIDVVLVAATKGRSVSEMLEYQACLERLLPERPCIFGENYLQEFQDKLPHLSGKYKAHYIGRLQSNKVKQVVSLFDVIQSVDSPKLAQVIATEAQKIGKRQQIFLQVNISIDPHKTGFYPDNLKEFLIMDGKNLAALEILGLMTITKEYNNTEEVRVDYATLNALSKEILKTSQDIFYQGRCQLSMGMSQDYTIAISEGATMIRLGSALFKNFK